jgi:hypothetical protein
MSYELKNYKHEVISTHSSIYEARSAAVELFGPDVDINDQDSDGRSLVWRNSEESQDDDGRLAVAVIVEV